MVKYCSKVKSEIFYNKAGWEEVGKHGKGEIKFEMTYKNWPDRKLDNTLRTEH